MQMSRLDYLTSVAPFPLACPQSPMPIFIILTRRVYHQWPMGNTHEISLEVVELDCALQYLRHVGRVLLLQQLQLRLVQHRDVLALRRIHAGQSRVLGAALLYPGAARGARLGLLRQASTRTRLQLRGSSSLWLRDPGQRALLGGHFGAVSSSGLFCLAGRAQPWKFVALVVLSIESLPGLISGQLFTAIGPNHVDLSPALGRFEPWQRRKAGLVGWVFPMSQQLPWHHLSQIQRVYFLLPHVLLHELDEDLLLQELRCRWPRSGAFPHHLLVDGVEIFGVLDRQVLRRRFDDQSEHFGQAARSEGVLVCAQLIDEATQRPNIYFTVVGFSLGHLGAEVAGRAHHGRGLVQ